MLNLIQFQMSCINSLSWSVVEMIEKYVVNDFKSCSNSWVGSTGTLNTKFFWILKSLQKFERSNYYY